MKKRTMTVLQLMAVGCLTLMASGPAPVSAGRFDPPLTVPNDRYDFFMSPSGVPEDLLCGTWIVNSTQSYLAIWCYTSATAWPYFAQSYANCSGRPVIVEASYPFPWTFNAECLPGEQVDYAGAFVDWP